MQKFGPSKLSWSRPLADLVGAVVDPVLARQGFGQSNIILYWDEIVGERIAAASQPLKLQWPPRGKNPNPSNGIEPASLVIRVESGFALELQHLAPVVIDRVNAHLGWKCVGRLQLKQGPIQRTSQNKRRHWAIDAAARAEAEKAVAHIGDTGLREALARLGARVLSEQVLSAQIMSEKHPSGKATL
jgi:hypothetical protein